MPTSSKKCELDWLAMHEHMHAASDGNLHTFIVGNLDELQ